MITHFDNPSTGRDFLHVFEIHFEFIEDAGEGRLWKQAFRNVYAMRRDKTVFLLMPQNMILTWSQK